jgi:2-iminobutanoate/2-iminopropanoate deaminase
LEIFMRRLIPVLCLAVGFSACALESSEESNGEAEHADAAAPQAEFLSTPEQLAMGFPFSEAVRVGPMLYLSGQIGNIPGTTEMAEGGIQGETRQILENIGQVLERYGSSMDRIVKCLVMIDDMAEWPAMNEVYAEFFPGPKPARSALGADGLALGAMVEIECMATVG